MKRHEQTRKALLPGKGARLADFCQRAPVLWLSPGRGRLGLPRVGPLKARALHLIGDFNGWNRASHPLTQLEHGNWEIFSEGKDALPHASHVKVQVTSAAGWPTASPCTSRGWCRTSGITPSSGRFGTPRSPLSDRRALSPSRAKPLLIYEAHIGMAQERAGVGTYREFTQNVLPYIQRSGYNAIQLMAVMEHPYYASFGYQVSNFFAASSWFGAPEDLWAELDQHRPPDGHRRAAGPGALPRGEEHRGGHRPVRRPPRISSSCPRTIPPGTPSCSTTASTRCCTFCSSNIKFGCRSTTSTACLRWGDQHALS